MCRGLFADVWKGRHHDQEVAARVFRVYSTSDVEDIRSVSWRGSHGYHYIDNLLCLAEVLQGGRCVEGPQSPKRRTIGGCDNDRESFRNGFRVVEEREHQRVCEGKS